MVVAAYRAGPDMKESVTAWEDGGSWRQGLEVKETC